MTFPFPLSENSLAEMIKQFTNRLDDMTTRQNEVSEKFTALELHTAHNVKSCINDIREREKRLAEKNTTRDSQWARQLEKTDFDLRADVLARLDENHAGMTKELATMETNNQTYRSNTDKQLDLMENTLKDALKDVVAHLEARIAKDKETIMESVHEQGSLLRTQATDMDGRIMRVRDDFGQRLEVFQQHMLRKIDEYLRDTNHAFDKVRVAVQEITSSVGQIESDFATKLTTDLTTQHVEHKALLEHCETRMRDTTELLVREEKRARLEHDTMRTRSLQQRLYAFEEKVKAETQAHLQYTIERLDAAIDDWDSRDVLSRQSLNIWKALLDTRLRDMRKQTDAGFEKAREFTAHVNESVRLGDARLTEELARHRKKSERDIAACADQQQNDMAVVTGRVEAGMLSLGGAISALESGLRDNALWTKRTFEETNVITNALKNAANEHKEAWEDSCKAYDAQLGSLMDKLETTVDTARSDVKANNERMDTNLTALRDQLDGQKEDAKEEMNGMKKQMKEDSENSTQMRGALKEKVREQINGADTRIRSFEETERKNTARLGSLEDAKPDYEIRMSSLKNRETTYGEDAKKGTQAEKAGSSKEGEESDEVSEESKQNAVDEEKAESEQETSEQRKKNAVDEEKAKRKEEASEQSKKRAVDNEKAGSEEEASEQGKASLANDEKAESDEQAPEKRKKNAPEYEKAENEKAASEQSEKKPWEDEKADGTEETYEHGKTNAADSEKAESVEGSKQGKDDVCKEEVTAQVST